jgi:hypothetical protein
MNAQCNAKKDRYEKDAPALMEKHFPNGETRKPTANWIAQCKSYCDERDEKCAASQCKSYCDERDEKRAASLRKTELVKQQARIDDAEFDKQSLAGFESLLKVMRINHL